MYSGLAFTRYSNIVPLKTIKNHPKPSNIRKNHQKSQKTWKSIKNHQNLFVFDIFPRLPYPSSTLYRSDSCGGRSKSKKHFKTLKIRCLKTSRININDFWKKRFLDVLELLSDIFSWFWAPLPLPSIFTHSWRQSGVQTNFGSPSWKYLLLFFRIVFWEDTVIYLHSHTPSSHFRANPMRFETFPIERVYFLTSWPDLPGLSESTLWGFTQVPTFL